MENKEVIKNKYYFEFLVNFINKNSNVLGEDDLRSFKMEDLIKIAGTYTDDVEHKWILSDENFQYLSELAKYDKTCPMGRLMMPIDEKVYKDTFITKPTEEPKVMEDVPELKKEDIMKEMSDLSSYSTKALFDELVKRGGMEAHWLNPESSYSLDIKLPDSCHDSVHFDGRGPLWIIFNYD